MQVQFVKPFRGIQPGRTLDVVESVAQTWEKHGVVRPLAERKPKLAQKETKREPGRSDKSDD